MNTRLFPRLVLVLSCLLMFAVATGCRKQEPEKDAFLEKWKAAAEQSQGHSPTYKAPALSNQRKVIQPPEPPEKGLPNRLVSLRMHKASLAAVLKALSRAGNQSIMLSPNISGEVTVNIEKKPWDQVFKGIVSTNGLAYRWEGDIIRVMTLEDMENDLKMADVRAKQNQQKLRSKGDEPLISEVIPIRYADADSLRKAVENILVIREPGQGAEGDASKNRMHGFVSVDNSTNALIVEAAFEDMKKIFNMVDKLDRPQKQVSIKANIVETTNNVARSLGMRYGWWARKEKIDGTQDLYIVPGVRDGDLNEDGEYEYRNPLGNGVAELGYGMNFFPESLIPGPNSVGSSLGLLFGILGENFLEVQLNALAQKNLVKILSSPSIVTLDNKIGVIENGQRVPYPVSTGDEVNVEFEDALLKLEIKPHVIDEDFLQMNILVTQDSISQTEAVLGYPVIDKRKSQTSLVVRNRETVVISGLQLKRDFEAETGFPGAKDIPVLGWLFKGQDKGTDQDEILVFLTPTILAEWAPGEIQKSLGEIDRDIEKQMEAQQAPQPAPAQ